MNKNIFIKALSSAVIICAVVGIVTLVFHYLLNKHSVPDKAERLRNLKIYSGITDLTELSESEIAHDLDTALSKYTNWDNLFLSENFKNKYKSRKNILDDVNHIANVHSGIVYDHGENVIVIFADKKPGLFDTDESDDITTEYYFRYVLNEAGEIDDLILLEKRDVYTMSGFPVDKDEEPDAE